MSSHDERSHEPGVRERRDPAPSPVGVDPGVVVRTCPNCSAGLVESRCKLLCPRCHYYMSCSDYY